MKRASPIEAQRFVEPRVKEEKGEGGESTAMRRVVFVAIAHVSENRRNEYGSTSLRFAETLSVESSKVKALLDNDGGFSYLRSGPS